ncbi:MAG: hypothetical protein LBU90_00725 [Bacteroidales bacterium]|jgi:hypothetical protein|nr:hypothetical protein [Bacteroidales bacterium]
MTRNILKTGIFLIVFATLFSTCQKQKEELLVGNTYIETFPQNNSTTIHFIDNEILTIKQGDYQDTYKYKIRKRKITLTNIESLPGYVFEFYFHIINRNKFEIGYLRPYIPEEYPGNMIFEKVK